MRSPHDPVRPGGGLGDRPVPQRFFFAYSGSGLVIQCFARFHPAPSRVRTCRTPSGVRRRVVHPLAWHTWATRPSVHRPVGGPNVRGDWWGTARRSSSRVRSQAGWVALGVVGWADRHPVPSAANARTASRTVWGAHPRAAAIWDGSWPAARASRTWLRRRVKASGDRRLARRASRSAAVRSRTNSGGWHPVRVRTRREPSRPAT